MQMRLAAFFLIVAAVLVACVAHTARIDALWIVRAKPPWLEATAGENRLIDIETRPAKTLHLLLRDFDTVLVGSSVMYRGVEPNAFAGRVYNAGLSSLMASELPVLGALIGSRPGLRRVIVGLDFFSFGALEPAARLREDWMGRFGQARLLAWAFCSREALGFSRLARIAGPPEPLGWTRDGFRHSPDRPPERTLRIHQAQRQGELTPVVAEKREAFRRFLTQVADRRVQIYVSPIPQAQRRLLAEMGLLAAFDAWRRDIGDLARSHGAAFLDLSTLPPEMDDFDPARGSSQFWIDSLHFRPSVGRWVARQLETGQPIRPD